jgi:hypothetical protein
MSHHDREVGCAMNDWFEEEAEKAFRKAIVRSPEHDTIAQWRERLTKFAKRIEAALAATDKGLEDADAKARIKKAVDYFERHRHTSEEQMRKWLSHVVPGWHRYNYEQQAATAAIWMPLLTAELERREKGRAERAGKAQTKQWEDTRKLRLRPKTIEDEIVSAGYRQLAKERHPDSGGTHEGMAELNKAADRLRGKPR